MKYPEWCEGSGVSEEIADLNCRPISDKAQIAKFLGWRGYQGATGWICQGVDLATGSPSQFGQFKPQTPHKLEDGTEAKYLSQTSGYDAIALTMPDTHYWKRVLVDPTARVVVTEGVKKSAALLSCGIPALAVCGVEMGLLDKRSKLVPTLRRLASPGRPVVLAFDSDLLVKREVKSALESLGDILQQHGCVVSVATWDEQIKGVDDLKVVRGAEAVKHAIDKSQPFGQWRSRVEGVDLKAAVEAELCRANEDFDCSLILPKDLADPLSEISASLKIPQGVLVVNLLAICGSLLKAGSTIKLPGRTHHEEPPILWISTFGESGNGKSPAMRLLLKGLDNLSLDSYILWKKGMEDFEERLAKWEAEPEKERGPRPKPPARRSYQINNLTTEAVTLKQSLQPQNGFLISVDELAGFFKSMNQYKSGGDDLEAWLSFYDGGGFELARVTRDDIFLEATSFSISGGIQPCKLKKAMGNLAEQDGFWPRFAFVRLPTSRTPEPSDEPEVKIEDLEKLYRKLDKQPKYSLSLSPEAKQIWIEWHNWIEDSRLSEGHEAIRVLYPKAKSRAARIALILAAIREDPAVTESVMKCAIAFTKWLLNQTLSIYDEMGLADTPESDKVSRFISKFKDAGWIKTRTVQRSSTGAKMPAPEARKFMASLVSLSLAISNEHPPDDPKYEILISLDRVDKLTKPPKNRPKDDSGCQHPQLTRVDRVDNFLDRVDSDTPRQDKNQVFVNSVNSLSTPLIDSQNPLSESVPASLSTCQLDLGEISFNIGDRVRAKPPKKLKALRGWTSLEIVCIGEGYAEVKNAHWSVSHKVPITDIRLIEEDK